MDRDVSADTCLPTVLEDYDGVLVKREDTYCPTLIANGKVRGVMPYLRDLAANGVTTVVNAGATHSNSHAIVAACAATAGLHAITVVNGKPTHPHAELARCWGADVIYAGPSHLGPLRARAGRISAERGATLLPWGLASVAIAEHYSAAVDELPPTPGAIHVVALGAGGIAAGICRGLVRAGRQDERVIAVAVMPTTPVNDLARITRLLPPVALVHVDVLPPVPALTPWGGDPRYEDGAWGVATGLHAVTGAPVYFWAIGRALC